ncbi:hypothetical protein [Streptomyces sp. NRRL S-1022]|uniref:hypothetical protein n=1 Tax=Streptomyces sp. NRRL S-1022 TaxID=1463880 RepID=UPI001F2E8778|nr:hypothetical protein [Streptomyces sp. NRRL S-1022]
MNGNQIEGLIGMLATLGILVLLVLPSALGVLRDRRIDRQLRQARQPEPHTGPAPEARHHGRRHGTARPA